MQPLVHVSRRSALALTAAAPFALAAVRPATAQAVTLKTGTSPTDAYAEPRGIDASYEPVENISPNDR